MEEDKLFCLFGVYDSKLKAVNRNYDLMVLDNTHNGWKIWFHLYLCDYTWCDSDYIFIIIGVFRAQYHEKYPPHCALRVLFDYSYGQLSTTPLSAFLKDSASEFAGFSLHIPFNAEHKQESCQCQFSEVFSLTRLENRTRVYRVIGRLSIDLTIWSLNIKEY